MGSLSNLTTREAARKIMKDNFIDLDEALAVCPSRKKELVGYETIPFSDSLLYFCSEPDNQYVLFPGIPRFGWRNRFLTVLTIKEFFAHRFPNLFADCPGFRHPIAAFIKNTRPDCKWYLVSKDVILDKEKTDEFFKKMEINQNPDDKNPWGIEPAVAYIEAWLLFKILRKEEIFPEIPFQTDDTYDELNKRLTCLQFTDSKIFISQKRIDKLIGVVPSIVPYLK